MPKKIAGLLRSERGVALPVAVSVLMLSGALAAAAATSATTASRQSTRDRSVKRAIAAADAGIQSAVYRLNHFSEMLDTTNQCVAYDSVQGVLRPKPIQNDGWCAAQSEDLDDGASFSHRVSALTEVTISGQSYYQRKIVSTGMVNGVNRRALETVHSAVSGSPLFPVTAFSLAKLELESNTRIDGSAGSNDDIEVKSNARICGDAHPGPGESFIGTDYCSGYSRAPAAAEITLPEVTIPATNDNATLSGVSGWTSAQRRLVTGADITLTGNTYVFCYLEINSNGRIRTGARTSANPLKIYIDSPANCNTSNEGSVKLDSNAVFDNQNSDPTLLQLYVKGTSLGTAPRSNTPLTVENNPYDTWVRFDSNSLDTGMTIFAPNSEVTLNSNSRLVGAVAAARVRLDSNAQIIGDDRAKSINSDIVTGLASGQSWIECPPNATGSAPDSGC